MTTPNPFDLQRLGDCEWIQSIEFRETTPSTNDLAKQLIQQQSCQSSIEGIATSCPKLVLTASQTAGRGQHDRTWWSGQGSLTFSLIEVISEPTMPLTTGLATALALTNWVRDINSQVDARIKWPNDLFVNGRKMAGILIESVHSTDSKFQIVGVGINVNNLPPELPQEVYRSATSLTECTGEQYDLTDLLIHWLMHYSKSQVLRRTDPQQLIANCLNQSETILGQTVTLDLPDGNRIEGKFAGLSERGGILLIESGHQREFLSATLNIDAGRTPDVS